MLRSATIAASALTLLLLGALYAHQAWTLPRSWRACSADPPSCEGAVFILALYEISAITGPDSLEVSRVHRDIPLRRLPTEGLEPGQTISVAGTYRSEGPAIEVHRWELHRWRPYKEALGLVGLGLALLGLPYSFARAAGGIAAKW